MPHFLCLMNNSLLFFRGVSQDDLAQSRRTFQQDDLKVSAPSSNMSRPSGKSIYSMFSSQKTTMLHWTTSWKTNSFSSVQRKEYSDKLNRQSDNFQVRVEVQDCENLHITNSTAFCGSYSCPPMLTPQHLFTCELDGQEVRTVDDCVAKLRRLDAKGRIWAQDMIMEVQRGYLLLTDIETKVGSFLMRVKNDKLQI